MYFLKTTTLILMYWHYLQKTVCCKSIQNVYEINILKRKWDNEVLEWHSVLI